MACLPMQKTNKIRYRACLFLNFTRFTRGSLIVLLTLRLSCLCAHSLPLRSIVYSKYDPNRLAAQATLATNLGTAMRALQ